eukprot:4670557-Pleurochrysis_carterae.AAC.2
MIYQRSREPLNPRAFTCFLSLCQSARGCCRTGWRARGLRSVLRSRSWRKGLLWTSCIPLRYFTRGRSFVQALPAGHASSWPTDCAAHPACPCAASLRADGANSLGIGT